MKRIWLLLLLPIVLGLVLKILLERGWLENSIVYLRIDLGTLALLLGLLLSILLFIIWGYFCGKIVNSIRSFLIFKPQLPKSAANFCNAWITNSKIRSPRFRLGWRTWMEPQTSKPSRASKRKLNA